MIAKEGSGASRAVDVMVGCDSLDAATRNPRHASELRSPIAPSQEGSFFPHDHDHHQRRDLADTDDLEEAMEAAFETTR